MQIIQSYVCHEDKAYFVSTINRMSSCTEPIVYAETLVWEWNKETKVRGDLVGSEMDVKDSIKIHLLVCDKIHRTGRCKLGEED